MEKVIASNKWERVISGSPWGENKRVKIEVEAFLVKRGENQLPHFSITGTVSKMDRRYRDPVITCGAIHDTIVAYFPSLAPLVQVHLSGPDGVPMYAEENARYWAGLSTWSDGRPMEPHATSEENRFETDENGLVWSPVILASHLQCDEKTAREVRGAMVSGLPWERIISHAGLIDLWSEQAGKARSLLNSQEQVIA